ncbi:MAG: hypothetical protein VW397_04695, partial [Candidatus Margulisiibacteriota bacterium]
NKKPTALGRIIDQFVEAEPNQPITEQTLRNFCFSAEPNEKKHGVTQNMLEEYGKNKDVTEFNKELSQEVTLNSNKELNPQNKAVLEGLMSRLEDTNMPSKVKGKIKFLIERALLNLNRNDTNIIGETTAQKLNQAFGNESVSKALAQIQTLFAENSNITPHNLEQLLRLEENSGINELIEAETFSYQGNTQNMTGYSAETVAGLIPGVSAGQKASRANSAYEERANTGTLKGTVLETIPKHSEKDAWATDIGTSIKEAIKSPARLTLRILTTLYDNLSGAAGATYSGLKTGRLDAAKTTFSQRGNNRRQLIRDGILTLRNLKDSNFGNFTFHKSKDQKLISEMNLLRRQISNCKDAKTRASLTKELKSKNDAFKLLIEEKKQTTLNGTTMENLRTEVNNLEKDLAIKPKKFDKPIYSATLSYMYRPFKRTFTIINGLSKQYISADKDTSQKVKKRDAALAKLNELNKYDQQLNTAEQVSTGLDNLEKNLTQNDITETVTNIEKMTFSPKATATLNEIKNNPEYVNTDHASQLESEIKNHSDKDNQDLKNLLKFIQDNKIKGALREKDACVSTASCVVANFEMGSSAIHPAAAAGISQVAGKVGKFITENIISYGSKLSNNESQIEILNSATLTFDVLNSLEQDMKDSLNKTLTADEKIAFGEFFNSKDKLDNAFFGEMPNEINTTKFVWGNNIAMKSNYKELYAQMKRNPKIIQAIENYFTNIINTDSKLSPEDKNNIKQFQFALKTRNPDGNGLADIILIPKHKQTYCLKKWAASNLG